MAKKTRKQDAESIVGKQADELDKEEKALKSMKSHAMVEMSDSEKAEAEEMIAEVESGESAEAVETVEEKPVAPEENKVEEPVEADAPKEEVLLDASMAEKSEKSKVDLAVEKLESLFEKFEKLSEAVNAMGVAKSDTAPHAPHAPHALQPAIDEFLATVDNSVALKSEQERADMVNPAFQQLGMVIADYLKEKSDTSVGQSAPAQNKELVDEIRNLTQLVSTKMEEFNGRLGLVETQRSQAIDVRSDVRSRIPARKSMTPLALQQKPAVQKSGLSASIRKSFGLE